ncbi:MAG: hypothetical protein AB7P17_07230 [Nitrospirales bacterium]|nr:hypothetical protein [Nitrospirales bacterium]
MNKEQAVDFCRGFFGSFLGVVFWLAFPFVIFIVPPLALILLFILPFCLFLTFIFIVLTAAGKRSKWVPIGVLAFLIIWALVGLYEKYEAVEYARRLEKSSISLDLSGLPRAFLTGNSSTTWGFPKNHESALLKGLPVFVRHSEGIHRFSIGTGNSCDSPKSLRATLEVKHRLPPGNCIAVEKVSPEAIYAVEFAQGSSEYKETPDNWLKKFGRGFPEFRWSYVPWSVVLHKGGAAQTIANGFTGRTQYPFWLPVVYIPFPHSEDYGRFGGANLLTSESKIGSGWTKHVFIEKLIEASGAHSPVVSTPLALERAMFPKLQKADDLDHILQRLTMLANSSDSDDRVAAANDVQKWIESGGELKAIEGILKTLLQYKMNYRKYRLYSVLMNSLNTVPDWLASLLIAIDPDWVIDELGFLLLKADPGIVLDVEKLYGEMFVKALNGRRINDIRALILLLPRFSETGLASIYSNCTISSFEEIKELLEYMNGTSGYKRVSYAFEEKQRLARHVRPCIEYREDWNSRREWFEKTLREAKGR